MPVKIFPSVLFVCLCPIFFAVAHGREHLRIIEKPELERLLTGYVKLKKLDSQFVQKKTIQELKLDLLSEGHLVVEKPQKIVWTVTKPSFLEVKINDKNIEMTTLKGTLRQTQIVSLSSIGANQGTQGLSLLVPWLEMNVDKIIEAYSIVELAPSHLRFTPKSGSLFKTIEMRVAKTSHIERLTFYEKNGDSIDITFKALRIENFK